MLSFHYLSVYLTGSISKSNKGFHTLSIILNIVGIFAGIVLLFNPLLAAVFISFMIAFMFILFGIFYVIDALAS
nr:DUF308 domain-containing protein [Mammaliicoccus sp. I-M36]